MRTAERIVNEWLQRLSVLRKIDPWMGIQTAYAFAIIAQRVRNEGRTLMVKDIANELETTTASATRNVRSLVNYGLIEVVDHPCVKVAKCIKITEQGDAILNELCEIEVRAVNQREGSPRDKSNDRL